MTYHLTDAAQVIRDAYFLRPYGRHGCSTPQHEAQRALNGRTHYVEPDSLKFHRARILHAGPVEDTAGLLYGITESFAGPPSRPGRLFRFVTFDITGAVVSDRDETHATAAKARAALDAWAESFDVLGYYIATLTEDADTARDTAQRLTDAAAALRT